MSGSSGRDLRRLAHSASAALYHAGPTTRMATTMRRVRLQQPQHQHPQHQHPQHQQHQQQRQGRRWLDLESRQRSRLRRMPGAVPVGHVQVRHCEQLKDVEARAQGRWSR